MTLPAPPNSSATGGVLAPDELLGPVALTDEQLDEIYQQLVTNLTNLPGDVVFPRWQPDPPNLPDVGTDWAAIGIIDTDTDTYAVNFHVGDGHGNDELRRHRIDQVLCSFYGPNARSIAELFVDQLQVPQNRETLTLVSMGLVSTGKPRQAPELVKNKWLKKYDVELWVKRQTVRRYPVLNLIAAEVDLYEGSRAVVVKVTP